MSVANGTSCNEELLPRMSIREIIFFILNFFYFTCEGFAKAVLPFAWLPKKKIAGKNVLITGAGSGIGRELAYKFANQKCQLILWDINETGALETGKQVELICGMAPLVLNVNVADRDAVYDAARKVENQFGAVDILVNNAGIAQPGLFLDIPDQKHEQIMQVNCLAHFWTAKAFLPKMIERKSGHIVNLASAAGCAAALQLVNYSASKFAVVGFSEAISLELNALGFGNLSKGIEVTTVCPTFIDTPMLQVSQRAINMKKGQMPTMSCSWACDQILLSVLTNTPFLALPRTLYVMNVMKSILPSKAFAFFIAALFAKSYRIGLQK